MGGALTRGQQPRTARGARRFRSDVIHLFVMTGVAVAQPIFAVVSANPTFLIAHAITPFKLVAFVLALLVVPPLILIAPVALLRRFGAYRAAELTVSVLVGLLFALTLAPLFIYRLGIRGHAADVLFLGASVGGAILYARVRTVRRYLDWLAPAPLVFALIFAFTGPIPAFFAKPVGSSVGPSRSPNVVYLLFDEFALDSLLGRDGSIDERRFPAFAELARRSTWYPNMTTNANATVHEVPSVLTGRYPRNGSRAAPTAASYPHNVFSLVAGSHRVSASEVVTSLCGIQGCERGHLAAAATKHLVADSMLLYAHTNAPPFVKRAVPSLTGYQWGGFFADPLTIPNRISHVPGPLKSIGRQVLRFLAEDVSTEGSIEVGRLRSFVRSNRPQPVPSFSFHHALLPHAPWHLLPDARAYSNIETPGFSGGVWRSQDLADAALQRYVLQVQAVDRVLGELIDGLDRTAMWDDTMVVVHADHGLTFLQGLNYRNIPRAEGDVLRVPMFIKYPGQESGKVDARDAELIDLLPTIADALDLKVPWPTDGVSLLSPDIHRPNKRAFTGSAPAVELRSYGAHIERGAIGDQIRSLFGPARKDDDVYAMGPFRDLVGRRVSELRVSRASQVRVDVEPGTSPDDVALDEPVVPARISARFDAKPQWPWIAVALNGRIAGLAKPYEQDGWMTSVMLSPRFLRDGSNEVRFFGVGGDLLVVPLASEQR